MHAVRKKRTLTLIVSSASAVGKSWGRDDFLMKLNVLAMAATHQRRRKGRVGAHTRSKGGLAAQDRLSHHKLLCNIVKQCGAGPLCQLGQRCAEIAGILAVDG